MDYKKRPTAEELLDHPMFQEIRQADFEKASSKPIQCPLDRVKEKDYSLSPIKKFIVQYISKIKQHD